jgi:acetoin utilization protein AcuB
MSHTVGDCMTVDVVTVGPRASLGQAMATMRAHATRHACVLDDNGKLVGILSDRDVTRVLPSVFGEGGHGEYGRVLESACVESAMTTRPLVTSAGTPLAAAVFQMQQLRIGALPVLDPESGQLMGILSKKKGHRALQAASGANALAA